MKFEFDKNKCIGCGACSVACMDQHDTDPEAGDPAFRIIDNKAFTSSGCMHCENAPCIRSCPMGCLFKDNNGFTVYDNSRCNGCHMCEHACPFGAIRFKGSKMVKCDGCHTLAECGLLPACVAICPTKALTLKP